MIPFLIYFFLFGIFYIIFVPLVGLIGCFDCDGVCFSYFKNKDKDTKEHNGVCCCCECSIFEEKTDNNKDNDNMEVKDNLV